MTDDLDTRPSDLTPDIAWIRSLAEEGSNAPLGGGRVLLAAGLIYGAASLFQWASIENLVPFSPRQANLGWGVATILFLAFTLIDRVFLCPPTGVKTAANRAARAAWSCVGAGIFAGIASMVAVSWRLEDAGYGLLWLLPSMVMVFYGLGWGVSAAMIRSQRLVWLSVASFVSAPLLALMTGTAQQLLAYAACLFLLMAVPGFLLMRAASAARTTTA
ncbi:MAG TPA: hypothetical protein VF633_11715 [Brevundimonas sp.]|jgi:hypothetical protein